jgi:LysR family transcriptional activator of nhaA
MEWINYHHYIYFYLVAREGGLAKAGALLRLSPQAISGQLRQLESQLGDKLFTKKGRRLVLTEFGRANYLIADEIFSLGQRALQLARTGTSRHQAPLVIGVSDVVPKLLVHSLIEPLRHQKERVRLVCYEDRYERLLANLATHELDVVIADAPASPGTTGVRAFNHQIAESDLSFFAVPALVKRLRKGFPASLDGAPFIMPTDDTSLGKQLRVWFDAQGIRPDTVAEVEDSALMKVFGRAGDGVFVSPTIIRKSVEEEYAVKLLGSLPTLTWRYYAITAERRVSHPALQLLLADARKRFS